MLGTPLGRILLDRPAWTYLLGPFFKASTPDQAAPLSATYREAGAAGALTVTDTGNKLTTAGGDLVCASNTASNDPRVVSPVALTRVAGRAIMQQVTLPVTTIFTAIGWSSGAAGTTNSSIFMVSAVAQVGDAGVLMTAVALFTPTAGASYDVAVILRAAGMFVVVSGGVYATPTLLWVGVADTAASLYASSCRSFAGAGSPEFRNLRVADLGGAWASDYGIATDRKATSAATDTITHTANCLVEHTITAATGVTQELWVRRTDASNGWIVRMSQAGSTIKLIEVVAGVETERASTAQTWTNGVAYRVVVICDGTTITPYVANVAKTGYASASTNQSATTAYVSDAGSDLVAWPRTVALPTGV